MLRAVAILDILFPCVHLVSVLSSQQEMTEREIKKKKKQRGNNPRLCIKPELISFLRPGCEA